MSKEFTVSLTDEAVDGLVVSSLKEAYEAGIKTILSVSRQTFDPLEDVLPRQAALEQVLNYFMAPADYRSYINYWNTHILEEGTTNEEDQDTGAND